MPLEPAKPVAKDGKPLSLNRTDALLAAILSELRGGTPGRWVTSGQSRSSQLTVATFTGAAISMRVLAFDARRNGVGFAEITNASYVVSTKPMAAVSEGIPVPTTGILFFNRDWYGSLVTSEWYWIAGANNKMVVVEVFD
jgi:hypothetical protein